MDRIGSMKNAILYLTDRLFVNGILIDTFEYYIFLRSLGVDVDLLIIDATEEIKDKILKVIDEKYNVSEIEYKKNVKCINKNTLIRMEFDKVLLFDAKMCNKVKGLINANEIIVISNILYNQKHLIMKNNNVVYYGEMPFSYKHIHYNMKMNTSIFKKYEHCDNCLYINSPRNDDYTFISKLNINKRYIIKKKSEHMNNMFEMFDEYLYYHANKWFDPKPRLFMECCYYNKKIKYINNFGLKDGSWYRYYDMLDNGISNRKLTKNDEIIQRFL